MKIGFCCAGPFRDHQGRRPPARRERLLERCFHAKRGDRRHQGQGDTSLRTPSVGPGNEEANRDVCFLTGSGSKNGVSGDAVVTLQAWLVELESRPQGCRARASTLAMVLLLARRL